MSDVKTILKSVDSFSVCKGNDDEKYHSLIESKRDGNFMDCSGMYYALVCVGMRTCDVVYSMSSLIKN